MTKIETRPTPRKLLNDLMVEQYRLWDAYMAYDSEGWREAVLRLETLVSELVTQTPHLASREN